MSDEARRLWLKALWIGFELAVLLALLDASETLVLYQNY
jgi:hypothetical protein